MDRLKTYFSKVNIFGSSNELEEENERNRYDQQTNVIATRVFFIILSLALFIFTTFLWSNQQKINITIQNPTESEIALLPSNRICLCSQISIRYQEFVVSNPIFHQVCSSDFVSDRWISSLFHGHASTYFLSSDIRSIGFVEFQALSSFCKLSKKRANRMLSYFGSTSFTSSYLVDNDRSLHEQVNASISIIQSTSFETFGAQIELISMLIVNNQLMNGLHTNIYPSLHTGNLAVYGTRVAFISMNYGGQGFSCYCSQTNSLNLDDCRGTVGIYQDQYDIDINNIYQSYTPSIAIPGFGVTCMPIDSCLLSSLECFYNQSCIDRIIPFLRVLDEAPMNFTALNKELPSRYQIFSRILSIIKQFMVEEWSIEESYSEYFRQCSPSSCTYSKNVNPSFLEILAKVIGLLGGLCVVLRIVVSVIVKKIRQKFWPPPANIVVLPSTPPPPMSWKKRLTEQIIPKLKLILVELNLFEIEPHGENTQREVRQQRIITRVYIILILLILVTLTLNFSVTTEIHVETVKNPSISYFAYLESHYGLSLQCPCSNIVIPYDTFFTIEPYYHQMCTSDFVSETWLELLTAARLITRIFSNLAFANNAGSQFFLLSTLCKNAKEIVANAYQVFRAYTFITTQVINEERFRLETEQIFNNWQIATVNNYIRTIELIRSIHHGNHLAGAYSNSQIDLSGSPSTFPAIFLLNSSYYYGQCNCMFNASCRSLMEVHDVTSTMPSRFFDIPNFYVGCSRLEGLLSSTMECFYDQTCLDGINRRTFSWYTGPKNFTLLNSSLNSPNETVQFVANRLFVDMWDRNISYNNYYTACAPLSCTYEYTHRRSLVSIITAVLGIFGGLTTALKILLIIFLRLISKLTSNNRLSINVIKIWFFAARTDKERLKNRLIGIILITTFSVLSLIYILSKVSATNEIEKPSFKKYENLFNKYSNTLHCPCSQMSIQYKSFLNISISNRHEICSSDFIKDEWIKAFLLSNLQSTYSPQLFQTSAIGFFQLLSFFCQYTEKYLNDEISNFINQSLIHSQIVSLTQFNIQIQSMIKQFQMDTSNSFLSILELIRLMSNNNTIISLFQTNWKWTDMIFVNTNHHVKGIHTKSMVYNGTCDCALSSECIQEISTTPGLFVGCYPLEALLKSNLQCLYNQSCIYLLQPTNGYSTPLNSSISTRYPLNSSIETILNELMVEQWFTNISYDNYYNACYPSYCLYSFMSHHPTLDILSSLLGLYGGLLIIITALVTMFVDTCQSRNTRIQPT